MKSGNVFGRGGTLLCILLAAFALSNCARSPEAKTARYLSTGKDLLKKHETTRAILQFRNALQTTPKNAEVYYQLGLAYLAAGDPRNAFAVFHKATELDPKHAAAQLQLTKLMASVDDPGMLAEAQQRLQTLLNSSPNDADALHALALTELKLGDTTDAVRHLNAAVDAAPQELAIASTLALVKLTQNDIKGAEEVLKKACERSPKSADAVVGLAWFYDSQRRVSDAEQAFQRALALHSDYPAAIFGLAVVQKQTGRSQEAEQNFRRLSVLSDKTLQPIYGTFLFEEGRRDEAVKEFQRLVKQDPNDRAARTRLVTAYQLMNRVEEAEKIVNAALKQNSKDTEALLQRGELYRGAGKYPEAEADLNRVLQFRPDAPEVHYALAKLYEVRGTPLRQRQELSEALRLNPSLLPVRLELAKSLMGENAQAALDLLDAAPQQQKNAVAIMEQRNWALLKSRDFDAARKGVAQGLVTARTPEFLLQDSVLKIFGKQYSDARRPLREILEKYPDDTRALRLLVNTYTAENQLARGVEEVKLYASQHPKSAEVQYFLGNLLLETGHQDSAKQAFVAAKLANPNYVPTDLAMAQVDLMQAHWDVARQKLSGILTTKGENTQARQWLGMLEAANGNQAAAIANFRKVIDAEPNNVIALNNLACLLADSSHADEALQFAQKAKELDPKSPNVDDTLGWVLYRKGVYGPAVRYLENAASGQSSAQIKFHLAMAYFKAGDPDRGRATLKAALRQDSSVPEAKEAQELFR